VYGARDQNDGVVLGLVPRIHVFLSEIKDVDGRDKPGHDVESVAAPPHLQLANLLATFIRCTLSPARWLQMKASRTSLSAW